MFRVIHPNRWFFWTIALLLITGTSMVLYIHGVSQEFERQAEDNAGGPAVWRIYSSQALGLSVRYPPLWQIEIDRFDEQVFYLENPENFEENISFAATEPNLEPVIRQSLKFDAEKSVVVDGRTGRWLSGENANDSATRNVVLVRNGGRLYYIAGQSAQFQRILKTVRFK